MLGAARPQLPDPHGRFNQVLQGDCNSHISPATVVPMQPTCQVTDDSLEALDPAERPETPTTVTAHPPEDQVVPADKPGDSLIAEITMPRTSFGREVKRLNRFTFFE